MRMKGKKVIFDRKDTYSLDSVLEPIILAGLVKFKEVLAERNSEGECWGVPVWAFDETDEHQEDFEAATKNYMAALDLMIYAFDPSKKPDGDDVGLVSEMVVTPLEDSNCHSSVTFEHNSEEAYKMWVQARHVWAEKCQEGQELFGKHFKSLWW